MLLQVGKWGNSLAVRLPAALALQVELKAGDFLKAEIDKNGNISLVSERHFDKAKFLRKLDSLNASLPPTKSVMHLLREEQRY